MSDINTGDLYLDCGYVLRRCVLRDIKNDRILGATFFSELYPGSCSIDYCGCTKVPVEEISVITRLTKIMCTKHNIGMVFPIGAMENWLSDDGYDDFSYIVSNTPEFTEYMSVAADIINTYIREHNIAQCDSNADMCDKYISLICRLNHAISIESKKQEGIQHESVQS